MRQRAQGSGQGETEMAAAKAKSWRPTFGWWSPSPRSMSTGAFTSDLVQGQYGLDARGRQSTITSHKFSTYATWWIRQAVTCHRRSVPHHSIPVHTNESSPYLRFSRELQMELGRTPRNEEIAQRMETTADRVQELAPFPVTRCSDSRWEGMATVPGDPLEGDSAGSLLGPDECRSAQGAGVLQMLSPMKRRDPMRYGIGCEREHTCRSSFSA
jgi:RNA polymerase primary sigma factor